MKKLIIYTAIIAAVFAGLYFLNEASNAKEANNIYKKAKLHPATKQLLDNPLYQNIILPEELDQKFANEDDFFVYYFKSDCTHCMKMTPIVSPIVQDLGIDLPQFNLLEFPDGWDKYNLKWTPTIVHYKQGKETERLVGENSKEQVKAFFERQGE